MNDYQQQDIETFDRFLEACTPEEREEINAYLDAVVMRFKKMTIKQAFSRNYAKHLIMRTLHFLDEQNRKISRKHRFHSGG